MYREPPYKRKRGNGGRGGGPYGNRSWNNNQGQQQRHKHWDEPGPSDSAGTLPHEVAALPPAKKEKPKRYQIDHELTQEELWDDSALIAAWDAAVEEYQSLHGPEKKWKEEPVHKSALWYAPAPKPQEDENEEGEEEEDGEVEAEEVVKMEQEVEPDSIPLDFNTFIPSHDPTLGGGAATQSAIGPHPPTTSPTAFPDVSTLTRDEIFEKAMSASYWSGYWTAMYHASGMTSSAQNDADEEEVEADEMVHVENTADSIQQPEL